MWGFEFMNTTDRKATILLVLIIWASFVRAAVLENIEMKYLPQIMTLKLEIYGKVEYRLYKDKTLFKVWGVASQIDLPKDYEAENIRVRVWLDKGKLFVESNYPIDPVRTAYGFMLLIKAYASDVVKFTDESIYNVAKWLVKLGYNVVFSGDVAGHVTATVNIRNLDLDKLLWENGFPYAVSGETITIYPKNPKEEEVAEIFLRKVRVRDLVIRFEKMLKVPIDYPKSLAKKEIFFAGKGRILELLKKLASTLDCKLQRTKVGFKLIPFESIKTVKVFKVPNPADVATALKSLWADVKVTVLSDAVVVKANVSRIKEVEEFLKSVSSKMLSIVFEVFSLKGGIPESLDVLSWAEFYDLYKSRLKLLFKGDFLLTRAVMVSYKAFGKSYSARISSDWKGVLVEIYVRERGYKFKVSDLTVTREKDYAWFKVSGRTFIVRVRFSNE